MDTSEPLPKRSEKTRTAILDAAEVEFAEHGFNGARIDAIAATSGHNKTLIFRYFGDKLALYAEVLKRVDKQAGEPLLQILAPLLGDETILSDAIKFRQFFKAALATFFDYMTAHPRVMHMILWEHAGGWQTYVRVALILRSKALTGSRPSPPKPGPPGCSARTWICPSCSCWPSRSAGPTPPPCLSTSWSCQAAISPLPPRWRVRVPRSSISSLPASCPIHRIKTPANS